MTAPEGPGNAPMGGAPAPSYPAPGPASYEPGTPPPGPIGYTPPAPPANRSRRGSLIILGVLALVVVGGVGYSVLTRDSSMGDITRLEVGDCIDRPTDATEITEIQHQPCNTPHDGEVIALLVNPAGQDEPYPVISGFEDYVVPACTPAFESYTGRDWETDTELNMGWLAPTLSGWTNDHDRSFTCYVIRIDHAKLNGSVHGVGSSPLP